MAKYVGFDIAIINDGNCGIANNWIWMAMSRGRALRIN
jgi:hypothetical protein